MKRARLVSFCSLLALLAPAGMPASAQAGSGLSISAEVRQGEIDSRLLPHAGTSAQLGRAVALIDASSADVTAVLQDYGGYQKFLPNFQASRVLSQRGASALVYVQVSILHGAATIWAELKLRPHPGAGTTRVIEATMLKGNVSRFEASWEITPVDAKHTLVAFQIFVDPDMPVPTSLIDHENQKNARKAVGALRDLLALRKGLVKGKA
jgi:ribosome-associated toxin RatA of RatAB toxin-antitoxin module